MLQLRRARGFLVRDRSVAALLKWLPRAHRDTPEQLAAYERAWPRLADYVPRALQDPFDGSPTDGGRPSLPAALGKYDIVMLPVFEFDFRRQRPQQLAAHFANAGHRVFWISPSRMPSGTDHEYEVVPLRPNLWEVHLDAARPNIYTGVLASEEADALAGSLSGLYREWAIAESAVVVQLPFWRSVGTRLRDRWGARLVFDCMDDWESMPGISEFNRQEERTLVSECDLLVLTARRLHDKYGERARRSVLAPNAVAHDFFSEPVHPSSELERIPRPVVGYVGAIAAWFDYELMFKVVSSRPQYSFVFVGALGLEQHVLGEEIGRFRSLPNVHLLGHKRYEDLPALVRGFDVCTIPFVINEVTRATDPVKVYEYFSLGKPVVATPMPELSDRSHLVQTAATAEDFALALDGALAEAPEVEAARRAYAASNTWSQRVATIDTAIAASYPRVSILIVTFNSLEFVDACLDSVFRHASYPNLEVLIADNGSTDGTLERLEAWANRDVRVQVRPLRTNRGFAGANNRIAREAKGDFLILLNIDTVVTPGWVERLIRPHRRDPSIGQVVPVTNWAGNEAKIDVSYRTRPEMEDFALRRAREYSGEVLDIPVAPLFCTLVPMDVWRAVGELDETFEIGMFEDDDYSLRVRRNRGRVVVAEDCFIHHFGRGSFAKLSPEEYERVFERNLRRFEGKWGIAWTPHRSRAGTSGQHHVFAVEPFCAAGQPNQR
jgi:GT2 family glycosyltransferase/glycosyltransferase involved in cell wall biosynthesis